MNSTLADSGNRTIAMKVSVTAASSMRASGRMLPSACGTPLAIFSVMSLATLPMSICPTAMSNARPSSAAARVRPVIACLVAV